MKFNDTQYRRIPFVLHCMVDICIVLDIRPVLDTQCPDAVWGARAAWFQEWREKRVARVLLWGSRGVAVEAALPRVRIASDRERQGGTAVNGLAVLPREAFTACPA